ncbi:MAG TPA: TonB-dependent receptor [Ignavibacteriaceae bacterium]|nr:TonB-dependent receptor [Ignavibacteriaceae bacterium]
MKNFRRDLFYFLLFILFYRCNGIIYPQQSGSISGKITDKSNNEALIGANVLIVNTTNGTASDIDGFYTIKNLTPGSYSLKISYISYKTITVEDILVKAGEDTKINVSMEPASAELDEIVVTAEALKSTESSVLKIEKNSLNIVDGVSAELIRKNNSSDGTDVLKRMTGVTMSEGKYAYIRGVGDRYNNTLLNGANLPSTDPEKKSFSYDLIPASLIENLITSKTFTPDKPADFSGGLVEINTIEFPSKFLFEVSTSGSFNSKTTNKSFLGYSGGKTDYLGIDDGTRDMPSIITGTKLVRGPYTDAELTSVTKTFRNNWQTKSKNAPFNGAFNINIGNKYGISDDVFGFIGSLSYSNSDETKELNKNFFDFSGARYVYNGSTYTNSINWSGLLNLSYKFANSNKISFKNIYKQNADDVTTSYVGDYRYAEQYREITSLDYVSRSLFSDQLLGEHQLDVFKGLNINWDLSYSRSKRNEPDARRYVYARAIDDPSQPLSFLLDPSEDTRYFGDLTDNSYNGNLDFSFKFFENPQLPKVKIGYAYNKKDRIFDARTFGFRNVPGGNAQSERAVLLMPIEQIFQPENITNQFIQVQEITKLSDSYSSNQIVNAAYLMFESTVFEKLRMVAGARLENSNQELSTFDLRGQPVHVKNNYNDLLPGINLIYSFNDNINVRGAFSTTLARPEFRELAPFSYFDFIANELVQGNPQLKRSLIYNYDLRFELYPGAGELFALSLFYKNFKNPIEQTLQASANEPIRSFANADNANNYGVELEIRQSLASLSDYFKGLSFVGNASFIHSRVRFNNLAFQQSARALQGQAPYIFNLGLYYDNYDIGLNTSVTYNKFGQRISTVGSVQLGNIVEPPVDLIDFSISKILLNNFSLKLTLRDLLNQDKLLIQQAPGSDKVSQREITGRNISLELKYQL